MKNLLTVFIFSVLLSGCGSEQGRAQIEPKKQLESLFNAAKALRDFAAKGGDLDPDEFAKLNGALKAELETFAARPVAERAPLGLFVSRYARAEEVYEIGGSILDLVKRVRVCKAQLTPRECHEQFNNDASVVSEKMLAAASLRGACQQCDPTSNVTATEVLKRAMELHQLADLRLMGVQPADR
jgi:hypothetical protein